MPKSIAKSGFIVGVFAALGSVIAATPAHAMPMIPTFVIGAGGSFAIENGEASGTKIQDESEGYKVFAGVENTFGLPGFQPSIGVEAQYGDLGRFTLNNSAGTHEAETIGVSLIGGVQLAEFFRANIKGGVHFWESEFGAFERHDTDFFYGLSAELKAAPFASIRFEWEHFLFNDKNFGFDSDLDVASVSFVFRAF